MRKAFFFILLVGLSALYSCKADQICASYQSYFLISPTAQPSAFSFQNTDSLPYHDVPELFAMVSEDGMPRKDLPYAVKNKNGLVKSEWPIIKEWNRRIVPMEVIIPEVDDSVLFRGDDIMFAERDVVDTLALDSARTAAQSVRYNNDQKFYNWYFRNKLVWADEQQQGEEPSADIEPPAKLDEPKPEKKKLFQRIFKNKEARKDDLAPTDSIG